MELLKKVRPPSSPHASWIDRILTIGKGKNEHVCWCVLKFFKLNERNFSQPSRQKFLSVKIFFQMPWKPFKSVKIYNTQTEDCRQTCFNRNVLWFNLILEVKLMQIKNLSMFVLTSIPYICGRSGQCHLARKSSILKNCDRSG